MKKGDARREQILLTAESLFCINGYDQTSIQDILDALHFSKGGFYHHFDSKLSLLEAISDMRAEESFEAARAALESVGDDPIDTLNTLMDSSSIFRMERIEYVHLLLRVAHHDDGALMREKMRERTLEMMLPLMDEVIANGVEQRIFLLPHPWLAGDLILRLGQQFTDEVSRILSRPDRETEMITDILSLLELYRHTVERMLSAPFGSVLLYDMGNLVQIVQSLLARRQQDMFMP